MMLEILPKIMKYKLYRSFNIVKCLPMNVTISLLFACNSRCKHVMYGKKRLII